MMPLTPQQAQVLPVVKFGLTAPVEPIRGHLWWNGSVLALFNGTDWINTKTGAIIAT
jgi:hypothetical protein